MIQHALIDRYVYAVTNRLPEYQREDIGRELRTLIEDLLHSDEPNQEEIEAVLTELGDPKKLSEQYRVKKSYLIGPRYFNHYILVLKIVGFAVLIGMTVPFIFGLLFHDDSMGEAVATYIGSIFQALMSAFAWVTIIFGLIDYYDVDLDVKKEEKWSIQTLPQVPDEKAKISPFEIIFGLVFITIFMAIFYFTPEVIAAYIKNDSGGYDRIPVFNTTYLMEFRLIIFGIFISSILNEITKLIYRRWNLRLAIISSSFILINLILTLSLVLNPKIYNPAFKEKILPENLNLPDWNQLIQIVVGLIIIINVIEMITTMYKGFKYNK